MRQEINLYQEGFRKVQPRFPAQHMLAGGVIVALLAATWTGWAWWRLDTLDDRLLALNLQYQRLENEQRERLAGIEDRRPAPALLARLKKLETLAAYQRPLQAMLDAGAFAGGKGYSDFFIALARQDLRGTWLTRIRVAGAGRDLSFMGYATTPDLVPRYLQRLTAEQALQGTAFHTFHMALPGDEIAKRRPAKIAFMVSTLENDTDWLSDE